MSDAALHAAADQLDEDALRETIRHRVEAAGTSFYWAMRLLPQERRNGMYAVYAFCREVDDIADGERPVEHKLAALAGWRDEIDALYRRAAAPSRGARLARAGRSVIGCAEKIFSLSSTAWRWMLARTSAPPISRPSTSIARASRAPSATSRCMSSAIPAQRAHSVAESLGRALQLTNILRDLDEDAGRGRLYLPREILDRHGIARSDPAAVLRHPALPAACRDLAAIAEGHFREPNGRWRDARAARCGRLR